VCAENEGNNHQLRFRSGYIMSTEITTKTIKVSNLQKVWGPRVLSIPDLGYAVVDVKLDSGRGISIYDYKLYQNGKGYKCIAITENDEPFDAENWEIKTSKSSSIYRLLFAVPMPAFRKAAYYDLTFALFNSNIPDLHLLFRRMKGGDFTTTSKVFKKHGLYGVTYKELMKGQAPVVKSEQSQPKKVESKPIKKKNPEKKKKEVKSKTSLPGWS
jgi:hypothetical protein